MNPISMALLGAAMVTAPVSSSSPDARLSPPIVHAPPVLLDPPLRVRQMPNWSDHRTYPEAARRRQQEGLVAFELSVDRRGIPSACRVTLSSGFRQLDQGTCAVASRMRFDPPASPDAIYRRRILWLLGDPTPFVPWRLATRIEPARAGVRGCVTEPSHTGSKVWLNNSCPILLQRELRYLVAADPLRPVIFSIAVHPDGAAPLSPLAGQEVARREIAFSLGPNGTPRDCRIVADRGFGSPLIDETTDCGFFLPRIWFAAPRGEAPRTGLFVESLVALP